MNLQQFKLESINGIETIKDFGKFENSPAFVYYFYELWLNGEGEYINEYIQSFKIEKEDVLLFPELKGYEKINLLFSENGFVNYRLI